MVFREGTKGSHDIISRILIHSAQRENVTDSFVGWRTRFGHLRCQPVIKGVKPFMNLVISELS